MILSFGVFDHFEYLFLICVIMLLSCYSCRFLFTMSFFINSLRILLSAFFFVFLFLVLCFFYLSLIFYYPYVFPDLLPIVLPVPFAISDVTKWVRGLVLGSDKPRDEAVRIP